MAYNRRLEFANFTLTFGDDKVLLDFYDEIVSPVFFNSRLKRRIKNGPEYFFLDTKLIKLNGKGSRGAVGIAGRFVKNTTLIRTQVYRPDKGVLVADRKKIDSAPSSIFLLLLHNHRLIYSRENTGAPSIKQFESNCSHLLRRVRTTHINRIHKKLQGTKKKKTKKELRILFPYPMLRVTPLSDAQSLSEFVDRFDSIDSVTINLLKTNSESIDIDDFWNDVGTVGGDINSRHTSVKFNNKKEGLNPNAVTEQAEMATQLANSDVILRGKNPEGMDLVGSNEDFTLSVPMPNLPEDAEQAARQGFSKYTQLNYTGKISEPELSDDIVREVAAIYGRNGGST